MVFVVSEMIQRNNPYDSQLCVFGVFQTFMEALTCAIRETYADTSDARGDDDTDDEKDDMFLTDLKVEDKKKLEWVLSAKSVFPFELHVAHYEPGIAATWIVEWDTRVLFTYKITKHDLQ
jgi:hypothetical protein